MPTVNIKAFSHKKSTVIENGGPKLPTAAQLELGEIAINFAKGYETLSIKNNNNEIVTFTNDNYWINKELAIAAALNDLNDRKQDALEMDEVPTEGSENVVTSGGLYSYITEIEQVTAAALNDLNDRITSLALSDDYAAAAQGTPPLAGDTYETAISKLHKVIVDDELITSSALNDLNDRIDNLSLSEDYEAADPASEPAGGDTYEEAISKLHGAILENELATSGALNDLNTRISDIVVPELILSEDYEPSSLSNEDLFLAPGDSYETAFSKLEKEINDNENITSAALTDLDSRLNSQSLDDIQDGSTRRLVTDAEKTIWNNKSDFSGSYNDLSNKPTTLAGYGITDAINTSSTAQTKAGNLTAAKFITSGGTSSQFVKGDGSLDSNIYMSQKLLESRGENLIYNGNGFMRDNTNFPSFVFDQTECNGSIGSFKLTGSVQATCTYSIPVSPSLTYMFRIDGKQSEQTKNFYALLDCYDVDGREILPEHYYWKEAEKTELTQDLVAGDTVIHLANISDEWLTTGETCGTVINFWNYTNSKGYTFPPYTYTRNYLNYGSYDAIDRATNTITLSVPYSGDTIPAGTKVSRKRYGSTYLYLWYGKFNSDWTTKTSILGGINTSGWADIQNGKHVFRPGTSFVKLGFLVNWSGANTQTTWITNISFSANDAGMSLPLIGGKLTGSIEATSFKKTGGTSSQFLKADGSVDSNTYLTSHQQLKTINNESLIGTGNITIQGGGSGEANVIETIKVNGTALTPDSNKAVDIIVPSAVTESTVSGWGFTKNSGTYSKPSGGIPKTDLTSDVQTSLGKADTALQSYTETDPTVPAWAKAANKPAYTASEVGALPDTYTPPVTSVNGQTGAVNLTIPAAPGTLNTTATTAQSTSSSEALSGNITLHKIAKTGSYNDLIGKPTIPAAQVQSDWNATSGMGVILNKPTIPTVNNATLTIQKNGTTVGTFTANASSNVTANIQVNELPTVSSSDNGKVLMVVNGAWSLVMPTSIYSGTSTPDSNTGNNGDIYLQTS